MKKRFSQKKYKFIVFIIFIAVLIMSNVTNFRYFSNMETAIEQSIQAPLRCRPTYSGQVVRGVSEIVIIEGEQGVIYIGINDIGAMSAFNFRRRELNNRILYRVGNEVGLGFNETWVRKMNTAPNSSEEILLGIGRTSAQEFAERTRKANSFILLEFDGNQYELWYIISADGFPDLPELRIQRDGITVYHNPSIIFNVIRSTFAGIMLIIVGIVIYRKKRKAKSET